MNRHVTRVCRILPFQYKMGSVSKSLSLSSVVGYLDRLQVVQERAAFKRPSIIMLSVSVGSIVCPSSCHRRTSSLSAISGSVYGFPVVVLPLFMSMALSPSSSLDNVQRFRKDDDSSLNFIIVFLRVYQALSASAADCAFIGMLQANRTLSCSDCFAKFVHLDVVHLFQLAL